jgi:hypothetical protein
VILYQILKRILVSCNDRRLRKPSSRPRQPLRPPASQSKSVLTARINMMNARPFDDWSGFITSS